MEPIRVGIVGCGRISDLHARSYQGSDNAVIAAVCDRNRHLARSKAHTWGVARVYTDYTDLLANPDIDMVEILTPHHLHCPMTVQAAQAGKHVSVQKPMAHTAAEADEMISAAEQAGVLLRVYETFVYYAPAVCAKQMLDTGEIGELRGIRMHMNTGTADSA